MNLPRGWRCWAPACWRRRPPISASGPRMRSCLAIDSPPKDETMVSRIEQDISPLEQFVRDYVEARNGVWDEVEPQVYDLLIGPETVSYTHLRAHETGRN